ncbi:MAG: YegS/Rv2252/BmrU family lipid kinase [Bacilli bacterium]|nr:YegS/Rv2252/BmrU family lipid kinase [Bacilli bacterium]
MDNLKKCVLIHNSKSGIGINKIPYERVIDIAYSFGYTMVIEKTRRKGHTIDIIKELPDDIDLVIAAGGDGTFNEAVRGNLQRKKKLVLSHLPIGTVNDVATMYGFSKNIEVDLEWIFTGVKKNIDVIMVNGVPFVYCAAYGNFVNISYETPRKLKEFLGRIGYLLFATKEINEEIKTNHLKITQNGKTHEGDYSFMFITNSSRVAGVNNLYPDAKLDDNKFEVLLCKLTSKPAIVKSLFYLKNSNDLDNIPGCEYYRLSELTIEFENQPDKSWGVDGEELKSKERVFHFTINKEVSAVLPEYNINKLFIDTKDNK